MILLRKYIKMKKSMVCGQELIEALLIEKGIWYI